MDRTTFTPSQYVALILRSNTIPRDYIRKAVERDELLRELKKLDIIHELPPALRYEDLMHAPRVRCGSLLSEISESQETLVGASGRGNKFTTLIGKPSFEVEGMGTGGIKEIAWDHAKHRVADEEEDLKMVKRKMLQKLADDRYVEIVLGFVTGEEAILKESRSVVK